MIFTAISGEVKKNVPAEGRTRRVLQDIGNLVVTNAQAAAEKNKVASQNEITFVFSHT